MYKATDALEADLLETKYRSTVTIAIALNDKLPEKNGLGGLYVLWIPRSERRHIAAVTRETAKEAGRAASGELINVMLSGEAGKKMIPLDDEKILTALIAELSRYLPDISKNITFTRMYRWHNAEPMSPIGCSRHIQQYRAGIRKNQQVILAGDYMGMPFTKGAAETGYWAASIMS